MATDQWILTAHGEGPNTRVLVRLPELTAWREGLDPLMRVIELVLWPDAVGIGRPFSLENRGWSGDVAFLEVMMGDVFTGFAEILIVYGPFR